MDRSETIKELAAALAKAKTSFKPVKKTASNPYFKSKYAPLENIIDATDKALSDNGLSISQFPVDDGEKVGVETMLMHSSGEFISHTLMLEPTKADPQGAGSAITYARRYSLGAVLGVASEDDDDGNASSGTGKKQVKNATINHPKPSTDPERPVPDLSEPNTAQKTLYNQIASDIKDIEDKADIGNVINSLKDHHKTGKLLPRQCSELKAFLYEQAEKNGIEYVK